MEVKMPFSLVSSLVSNLEVLKELPTSEITMQIRADNLTISALDKGMSSLFQIEIPSILFTSFPDGKRSAAIKVSIMSVISALKRRKQISNLPTNTITSSLLITPNALIIRSEIAVPDPSSSFKDSIGGVKSIHKITKISYEETTLLKASHPPIEDYPIQFLLGDSQFKTILRSLSLPQVTEVILEISQHAGVSLTTSRRKDLPSTATITLTPSSASSANSTTSTTGLTPPTPQRQLDVFHCELEYSKISLNIRDLTTLSKLAVNLATSIVFHISSFDEPIIIKLLPVGKESITGVCTSLSDFTTTAADEDEYNANVDGNCNASNSEGIRADQETAIPQSEAEDDSETTDLLPHH